MHRPAFFGAMVRNALADILAIHTLRRIAAAFAVKAWYVSTVTNATITALDAAEAFRIGISLCMQKIQLSLKTAKKHLETSCGANRTKSFVETQNDTKIAHRTSQI
jgi:hypothetical protein